MPSFDAVGTATFFDFASGGFQAHTCTGSDLLLEYPIYFDRGGGASQGVAVTYNGISLSLKQRCLTGGSNGSGNAVLEIWELIAPPAGTHDIVWTANNDDAQVYNQSFSFSGVDQVTPTGAVAKLELTSTASPTVTPASASGELEFCVMARPTTGITVTDVGSQTRRATWGFSQRVVASTVPGASSLAIGYGLDFADDVALIGFSLKPVSAAGAFIPIIGRGPGMALAGRGGLVARPRMPARHVARASI